MDTIICDADVYSSGDIEACVIPLTAIQKYVGWKSSSTFDMMTYFWKQNKCETICDMLVYLLHVILNICFKFFYSLLFLFFLLLYFVRQILVGPEKI